MAKVVDVEKEAAPYSKIARLARKSGFMIASRDFIAPGCLNFILIFVERGQVVLLHGFASAPDESFKLSLYNKTGESLHKTLNRFVLDVSRILRVNRKSLLRHVLQTKPRDNFIGYADGKISGENPWRPIWGPLWGRLAECTPERLMIEIRQISFIQAKKLSQVVKKFVKKNMPLIKAESEYL